MKKEELEKLYFIEKKTTKEIAKIYKMTDRGITYWTRKFGIKIIGITHIRNLEGQKFGKLTAQKYIWGKRGKTFWECKCECGNIVNVHRTYLTKGKKTHCGCLGKYKRGLGKKCPSWKGVGDISGTFLNRYKNHSKRRKIEYRLDPNYLIKLLKKQNYTCALTGDKLEFDGVKTNASIDRINSDKGYEEGNVQWVTKEANFAKQRLTNKDFIKLCQKVVNYQGKKEYSW